MTLESVGGCVQTDCTVDSSGKCLEGLETSDCPHYVAALNLPAEEEAEKQEAVEAAVLAIEAPTKFVRIPYGEDFNKETARRIMRNGPTRVIVLAGDVNSGKTTILTSIYEKFIDGPFAGYLFAGSETLPGFEQRCHYSRVTSEAPRADTARTLGDMTLLHLRVKAVSNTEAAKDLLFSDISGEDFEAARNSIDFCKSMSILRRADRCLLLIDGRSLADPEQRHKTSRRGEMLLRSFLDADMLGLDSKVDVLFTKFDFIASNEDSIAIEKLMAKIERDLIKKFSSRLGGLAFHRIAARADPPGTFEPAFGLIEVFSACVEDSVSNKRSKPTLAPQETTGREFDKYLERRIPSFLKDEFR